VLDFLVARYGEFVLLKPRFSGHTAILWLMPLIVLLIGAMTLVVAWRRYRRRSGAAPVAVAAGESLTPAETAQLSRILRQDGP
jgi:cytochrome c-type biogenesis protein CcmH